MKTRVNEGNLAIDILIISRNGDRNQEPVEPVQMKRLRFDDEPKVQERQQVKDQQSYISVFVARLTFPCSN